MKGLSFTITLLLLITSATLFATDARKQLQLQLRSPYGAYDEATIYFDVGITPVYSAAADVQKVMNTVPYVLNIYSVTSDGVKCKVYGYSPLTQTAVIPIGVLLDSAAEYTFTLSQFSGFDSTTLVILEDRKLNVFTEMQTDFYQVALSDSDSTGRFFLHVTSGVQLTPVTAGCNNNNGEISVAADTSIVWNTVSLSDTNNVPITSYSNVQSPFTFTGLAEGTYQLTFNYGYYVASKSVSVNGNYITVSIAASTQNVAVGETIDFTSTSVNSTEFVWTFGDSTIETGVANPTYFYYTPGTYTVILTCSNAAGCSEQAQITIDVSEATGINNPDAQSINIISLGNKTIQININNIILNNAVVQVYNLLGQTVYEGPVTANEMQIGLSTQATGVYIVSVINAGKATNTKVFIN